MNINVENVRNVKFTNKLQGGSASNPVVFKMKKVASHIKEDYCRLCAELLQIDVLVPIFDINSTRYEHMLELCLPGKFKENDKYPHMICQSCVKKLEECYKILISFMRADNIIRKIFNKGTASRLRALLTTKINYTTSEQAVDEKLANDSVIKIRSDLCDDNLQSIYAVPKRESEDPEDPLSLHAVEKKQSEVEEDPLALNTYPKKELEDPLTITRNNEVFNDSVIVDNSTENKYIQPSLPKEKPESSRVTKDQVIQQEEKLEIKYQCLTCLKLFNNKKEVTDHSLSIHPTKENNEKVFRVVMAKLRKKKTTIDRVSNKNKDVNIENIDVSIKSEDVNTEKVETTKEVFEYKHQCVKCFKLFKNKLEFHKHSSEQHSTKNRKIVCKLVKVKKRITNNEENLVEEHPTFVKYENLIRPSYQPLKTRTAPSQSIPETLFNCNILENNETKPSEPIETFKIKYQCKACSILFNCYKEVLYHSEHLHPTLKESGAVASLVKVKDIVTTTKHNYSDKEKNNLVNENLIICINDGTIIEVDPNVKPRKLKYSVQKIKFESRFKCLKCNKLFETKKLILQHSLTVHLTELTPGWNEINCKMVQVKKELTYRPKIRTIYECLICSTNHITKSGLIKHTRIFHPSISTDKFLCRYIDPKNKQFKECLHCNIVLKNYTRYREHMPKHASFTCEECGSNLDTLNDFRVHLQTHKEPKPVNVKPTYACNICETEFTSKVQLRKHKPVHNIHKEVSCLKCNKPFTSEFELKKHEQVHDTRVCDVCGKTFDVKYIQKHIQTHNIGRPYQCKTCPKTFKTQDCLWTHQRAHKSGPSYIMCQCQVCGKVIRKGYLNLHMRIHTGLKPEVCDICGMSFRRKDHLRNHLKTHMEDRSNPCPICNIPLYGNQSYWSHLSIMHGKENPNAQKEQSERPFTCVLCQKTFSQKCYLQDHFRRHTGQKICSCKICGKGFASKVHLWQHKFAHMDYDQLPYKCEYCDKKFKRSEHLRNHRRIHTGEKPFPCPICQRPFRVRAEMVKHTRIHKKKEERVMRKKPTKSTRKTVKKTENDLSADDSNSSME